MAFIYPQNTERKDKDHGKYLVSVDEVEKLTGLDFFMSLSLVEQRVIEGGVAEGIW